MSIHRKFNIYNLHGEDALVPQRTTLQMSVEDEQHKHLRKVAPTDGPLARTLKWSASLPSAVQPTALIRLYPRIANLVAATWRDPKGFAAYMESLLHDQRGNRRGFPSEVRAELATLRRHYDTRNEID